MRLFIVYSKCQPDGEVVVIKLVDMCPELTEKFSKRYVGSNSPNVINFHILSVPMYVLRKVVILGMHLFSQSSHLFFQNPPSPTL